MFVMIDIDGEIGRETFGFATCALSQSMLYHHGMARSVLSICK